MTTQTERFNQYYRDRSETINQNILSLKKIKTQNKELLSVEDFEWLLSFTEGRLREQQSELYDPLNYQ